MAIDMIENNENLMPPRTGTGFVNDMQIVTKSKYRVMEPFVAADGGILNKKEQASKNAATRIRARFGAAIQNCAHGESLLSQLPEEIERVQKSLTVVKKAKDRAPLEGELKELFSQEARIKAAMSKLKCVNQEEIKAQQEGAAFTDTLNRLTASAGAGTGTGAAKNNTVLYIGIGAGVLVLGGLIIYLIRS
jgi:hypothetical protein